MSADNRLVTMSNYLSFSITANKVARFNLQAVYASFDLHLSEFQFVLVRLSFD